MSTLMTLQNLPIGKKAIVISLDATGKQRRRLLDLGLIIDSQISALHQSPFGDPVAYDIRGTVIALRSEESKLVNVKTL